MIMQGLEFYNQKFLEISEHFSEFIQARVLKQPNIWHDRIPRPGGRAQTAVGDCRARG